ncbi:MAG: hypothetical protein QF473_19555, partial [Planctomycetota bacterium]|nr:hypothetical protein [Planctomycetota bacterium]
MKYLLPVIALIATFTDCVPAAPLVKNSDFTARTPDDESRPANWHVPDASAWRSTNEDGFSGQDSARYRTPRWLVSGPVTQSISLPAKTDLVLTAAVKRDNSMKPIVRIVSGKEGRHELVRIVAAAQPGRWTRYVARFKSGAIGLEGFFSARDIVRRSVHRVHLMVRMGRVVHLLREGWQRYQ